MILPCFQLGWRGFLTWILTLGSEFLMGFLLLFFFHVGSSTSSFGCEEPIEINILGICIELKEPNYVILKLQK